MGRQRIRYSPEKARAYYLENRRRIRERLASKQRFIASVKLTAGCCDCEYATEARRLHFDHPVLTVKVANVGTMVSYGWEKLISEIMKCDVRCADCHEARHRLYA